MAIQTTEGNTIVYQLGLIAVFEQPAKIGAIIYSVYQVDKNGDPIKFYNSHIDKDRAEKEALVIISDIAVNNTVGSGIDPVAVPGLLNRLKQLRSDMNQLLGTVLAGKEVSDTFVQCVINDIEKAIKSAEIK